MRAVALGSRKRMITAAKRRGLNSVLRQRRAICLRSRRTPRLAVEEIFWIRTRIVPPRPSGASITEPATFGVCDAGVGTSCCCCGWLMVNKDDMCIMVVVSVFMLI